MRLSDAIDRISGSAKLDQLKTTLQTIIGDFGFSGFSFVDAGRPHLDEPFYFGTTGHAWEEEYRSNNFVHVDPCISRARRSMAPFTWDMAPPPRRFGKRKPKGLALMEAAHDHGFANGYVFPFHYVDRKGVVYSTSNGLFWKDTAARFNIFKTSSARNELDLLLFYWTQRVIDVAGPLYRDRSRFIDQHAAIEDIHHLTDREREVLSWAGRGLTVSDTSKVLKIGEETVQSHLRHTIRKLDANNKTHAVAKGIMLGYIDL